MQLISCMLLVGKWPMAHQRCIADFMPTFLSKHWDGISKTFNLRKLQKFLTPFRTDFDWDGKTEQNAKNINIYSVKSLSYECTHTSHELENFAYYSFSLARFTAVFQKRRY
jgi:hypothetical protein